MGEETRRASRLAGGEVLPSEKGDSFLLPRGAVHTEETVGDDPAEMVFAHVGGVDTVMVEQPRPDPQES
jgi:hypothetical protein